MEDITNRPRLRPRLDVGKNLTALKGGRLKRKSSKAQQPCFSSEFPSLSGSLTTKQFRAIPQSGNIQYLRDQYLYLYLIRNMYHRDPENRKRDRTAKFEKYRA